MRFERTDGEKEVNSLPVWTRGKLRGGKESKERISSKTFGHGHKRVFEEISSSFSLLDAQPRVRNWPKQTSKGEKRLFIACPGRACKPEIEISPFPTTPPFPLVPNIGYFRKLILSPFPPLCVWER